MQVRGHNGAADYQRVSTSIRRELGDHRLSFGEESGGLHAPYRECGTKLYDFFARPFWLRTCNVGIRSMDQISVLAAAGMQSRMQSLDLVANNLANSSTGGYKTDGEFYTLFTSEAAGEDASGPSSVPMIQRQWTDFAARPAGTDQQSAGFRPFRQRLLCGAGPFGTALYPQRKFSLLQQRIAGHQRRLSAAAAKRTALQSQHLAAAGRLARWRDQPERKIDWDASRWPNLSDSAGLTKYGANYFSNTTGQEPADATGAQIYQGKIEASNVSASHGAVRIVGLSRQFEMMQKAISISNDMGKKAIEEVAKV